MISPLFLASTNKKARAADEYARVMQAKARDAYDQARDTYDRERKAYEKALDAEQALLAAAAPVPERPQIQAAKRQYFLEVQIHLPAERQKAFVEGGVALLPAFEEAGLIVKASAWNTETDPLYVVNYWDMGSDANTLLTAELMLPDVPGFNAFNEIIDDEVKSIAIPIGLSEQVPLPPLPLGKAKLSQQYKYLRVSVNVDSADLPEFAARIEGYMTPFTRDNEWFLGTTYYSISGEAGAVSQLWVIPPNDSHQIAAKLRHAPWLRSNLTNGKRTFEILGATPSDPNLDPTPLHV